MPEDNWYHGGHNAYGEMDTVENAALPERLPPAMELRVPRSFHPGNLVHAGEPPLVAAAKEPLQLSLHRAHLLDYDHNKCQQQGVGCSLPIGSRPRKKLSFLSHMIVWNVLELWAAFSPLQAFHHLTAGASVLLILDNTIAVSYIKRQEGTRSLSPLKEVEPIKTQAQVNLSNLTAVYLPGVQNVQADILSRVCLYNEGALHTKFFMWVLGLDAFRGGDCSFDQKRFYIMSCFPTRCPRSDLQGSLMVFN